MTPQKSHLILDGRTVALFAGLDVVYAGYEAPFEPVLELSIMAVGHGGWRQVAEHVAFGNPFTDSCNDALWSYLDLIRMTSDGREMRISATMLDGGAMPAEAREFCEHVRSRVSRVRRARFHHSGLKARIVHEVETKHGHLNFVDRRRAEAHLSCGLPTFNDADLLAFAAEVWACDVSPELRKKLLDRAVPDGWTSGKAETDVTKTGDVTIILTSPDGEKVIVDTEAFIADVIANHAKTEPVGDRLQRAQLALAEAKLARMGIKTGVERFDRMKSAASLRPVNLYTDPKLTGKVD